MKGTWIWRQRSVAIVEVRAPVRRIARTRSEEAARGWVWRVRGAAPRGED
ncbi:MAG: hypothetical protein KC583_00270 [Myxococcales bacterium]|nr:hypothetical protein [Myxococcales bacterium]